MIKQIDFNFRQGFTLPEILVVVGISSLITLFTTSILLDIFKLKAQIEVRLANQSDIDFTVSQVNRYITQVRPSFNNIVAELDDNGMEFFQYFPDLSMINEPDIKKKSRILTLGGSSSRREFVFLVNAKEQIAPIYYDPKSAYQDVEAPDDFSVSGALNFTHFNAGDIVSSLNPQIWKDSQFILLRSPIPLRYIAGDGSVDLTEPPREYTFLGKVSGNDLLPESLVGAHTSKPLEKLFYNTNSITKADFASVDEFLRKIPPIGGASPLLLVEAVHVMRFQLDPNADLVTYTLYIDRFVGGSFTGRQLIAPNVKEIQLTRESVSRPLIKAKVTLQKQEKK